MLYREIIAVCSQIHTKHINTQCGQNLELLNVKLAAYLLRSWVRIPPGAWIFVCCECRVLSCRGLCDELITRPEESYRLWCVVVCDLETSRIGAPCARLLRSWVRIPLGAWIFVCCECRVLSCRGLCDELITRPEESYRLCCVVVRDLETSRIGAPCIYMTLVA